MSKHSCLNCYFTVALVILVTRAHLCTSCQQLKIVDVSLINYLHGYNEMFIINAYICMHTKE